MKIVKYIALISILVLLGGCWQETLNAFGNFFGENTPEGQLPPSVTFFGSAGPLLPAGLGTICLIFSRVIYSGIKIKKALFESNKHAIENGTLINAGTEKEVKKAFNEAQNLHDESRLLKSEYSKFKNGGLFSRFLKFFDRFLPKK